MQEIMVLALFASLLFAIRMTRKAARLEDDNERMRSRLRALRIQLDNMVERPF